MSADMHYSFSLKRWENLDNLIGWLQYDRIQLFHKSVVAYFFGHPVQQAS